MASNGFEPVIVGFTCNWCSYRAADTAGMARIKYAPNVRLIRLMCSGRLDPQFVLKALAEGADGVLISGCHPGDCHYIEQNYKTIRRYELLKKTLAQPGHRGWPRQAGLGLRRRGRDPGRGGQQDGGGSQGAGAAELEGWE